MDGHFGSCLRFLVYQVSKDAMRLIALRSTEGADESDDRNAFRADLIKDCQVLYVVSIGGPAAAKVIKAGIYPMKLAEEGEAREVLVKFQTMLAGSPPPWLAKITGVSPLRARFNADAEESFEEPLQENVGC
jgi:nitrogen fixation protein NifX